MDDNKNIKALIEELEDLLFDSIVFIFGINEGEYLEELKKRICRENIVFIIEPDKKKYNKFINTIQDYRIKLLSYDEEYIKDIINNVINFKNFKRLRVHAYGDYEEKYKIEFTNFIKYIDNAYLTTMTDLNVSHVFKTLFFENIISNLSKIKFSTPINSYININKDIPAIIVSGGPSLDKNIQTMLKHKNILDKFFIIAGNRTLGSLIKNGITPNLVISIDSQDITYEMIKPYIDYKIPLAFYEGSNKILLNEYKGDLIYIADILPNLVEELKDCKGLFNGGSVAHECTDFAQIMGCNPIIFVGQDLAYTFNKQHSNSSTHELDKKENINNNFLVKDIYGNSIKTSFILNFYKKQMEEYINIVKKNNKNIEFYNASYGADIIGAQHIELEEILNTLKLEVDVKKLDSKDYINFDSEKIVKYLKEEIDKYLKKSEKCIEICKELSSKESVVPMIEMKLDDKDLQKFIYVYETVQSFETSKLSNYIRGYVKEFIFEVRELYFNMTANDYENLTSNMKFQSNNFLYYFTNLIEILKEIKNLIIK